MLGVYVSLYVYIHFHLYILIIYIRYIDINIYIYILCIHIACTLCVWPICVFFFPWESTMGVRGFYRNSGNHRWLRLGGCLEIGRPSRARREGTTTEEHQQGKQQTITTTATRITKNNPNKHQQTTIEKQTTKQQNNIWFTCDNLQQRFCWRASFFGKDFKSLTLGGNCSGRVVSCIEDVQLSCDLEMAAYTFPGTEETNPFHHQKKNP